MLLVTLMQKYGFIYYRWQWSLQNLCRSILLWYLLVYPRWGDMTMFHVEYPSAYTWARAKNFPAPATVGSVSIGITTEPLFYAIEGTASGSYSPGAGTFQYFFSCILSTDRNATEIRMLLLKTYNILISTSILHRCI